ncbi:hypothetical protein AMR95_01720 [Bacillus sp. G1(2015b)]|nr:hypothetical protein AMR95_01720 [Bacillus sp. G1(2015b)]
MNSEGELTTVISAYRIAETKLNDIEDEIEHAEFYFKISEVYYYMKQTYFSLNYAKKSLRIYSNYDTYHGHIIHVQCVIAGILMDILDYEGALSQFKEKKPKNKQRVFRRYILIWGFAVMLVEIMKQQKDI